MAEAAARGKWTRIHLICAGHGIKMRSNSIQILARIPQGGRYASEHKRKRTVVRSGVLDLCDGKRAAYRKERSDSGGVGRRSGDTGNQYHDGSGSEAGAY